MSTSNKGATHVVSVIVYGAKGLKPKKEKHKFCVIYGVGKTKFRTDVVEDLFDNPVFNKETEITVNNLDLELKFKVTEKHEKDVLGQVIVPLYELGDHSSSSPHKVPLRPHKKCPTPHGLLIFEAWVTTKKDSAPSKSSSMESLKSIKSLGFSSGLKKLKDRIYVSGKSSDEKNKKANSESLFSLKTRSAVSCQDMTRESPFYIPTDRHSLQSDVVDSSDNHDRISQYSDEYPKRGSIHLEKVSEFSCPMPEVTSISPKTGAESGGTYVTIRGSNLGQNQDDIVALTICGSSVLATLQYISPWKLQCKTLPWKPCVGSINVETLSGGRGTSLVQFTFAEAAEKTQDSISRSSEPGIGTEYSPGTGRSTYSYNDLCVSDDPGRAVPYQDVLFDGNPDADSKAVDSSDKPPLEEENHKKSCLHSEKDGSLRLSVGATDVFEYKDDVPSSVDGGNLTKDITSDASMETVSMETMKIRHVEPVSEDAMIKKREDLPEEVGLEFEAHHKTQSDRLSDGRPRSSLQNGSSDILTGQEKRNGKASMLNGQPVKLPPPIVEIQPMRMEDKSDRSSYQYSESTAPRKPPRQFQDRKNEVNEMTLTSPPSSFQTNILKEDVPSQKKYTDEENEAVKDLEMQLQKKTNEIEMLVQLKKSLQDENWRLKQYIEALIMRAIKLCPEVLCVDESFA